MPAAATGKLLGTVLIVDDHEVVRVGLVQLLRRSLKVKSFLQAETLAQAIEHLDEASVRLVLLDLGMPGMAIIKTIRRMRRLRPEAKLVVLSGSEARRDILDALEGGAHGYIVKNQNKDQLVERLRYVLSGGLYVPPALADLVPEPLEARANDAIALPSPARKTLSNRQRQVLKGIVEGKSNKEIARELSVAEGTIKIHLTALFRVLGASNRTHAAALGRQLIA